MNRLIPFLTRALLAFVLGALMPLRAQLDPRLAVTPTDFLNLYQQSVSTKIKPEIATIFDFSGSMRYLMFHKLYPNRDLADNDDEYAMKFEFYSSPGTRTYTIKASANGDPSNCYATFTIKVGSTGTANSPHNWSKYSISKITCTSAANLGSQLTFQTSLTGGGNTLVDWVVTDNNGYYVAFGQSSKASSETFAWVVPAAVTSLPVGRFVPYYSYQSLPILAGMGIPVKPNGSLVTTSDANLAKSSSSGLYGLSAGASDIRNWVRAASHMRFQYSDDGTLRTVDIPIPWKITSAASTGNPLSSLTIVDPVSNTTQEFETGYTIGQGASVLSGGSGTATSTTMDYATYKAKYVHWLFQGRYLDGTYAGKYLVYDAANISLVGGQGALAWGQGYGSFPASDKITVPTYDAKSAYQGEKAVDASSMIVPSRSRCQAVKQAAISTWIKYQNQVVWAYRFLDVNGEADGGNANQIDGNSNTVQHVTPLPGVPTTAKTGCDSAWCLLNNTSDSPNNSVNGMRRLAALFPYNGTPLTYAMARTLAQFSDPNSVFNSYETGSNAPPQCLNHFVILFTDGVDNNGTGDTLSSATPYLSSATTGNAVSGNLALLGNQGAIDCKGSWWNIFTYAGIAAHLADSSLMNGNLPAYKATGTSYPTAPSAPSAFLPFAIKKRNNVTFQYDHRIQTLTVGVSLAGNYNDPASPKRSLFIAAAVGDPNKRDWDLDGCTPFKLQDEAHPESGHTPESIYFFDATDPDALVNSLDSAFLVTTTISNTNATTNPNLPFVGGSLGQEIYLGSFVPPKEGGVLWNGDLMMFSTRYLNGTPQIVGNTGEPVTALDASMAQWSAASALSDTLWSARKLYTRIPGSSSVPEPGLVTFSDQKPAYSVLAPYVLTGIGEHANPTDAQKQSALQWVAGGDTNGALDGNGRPKANRNFILGDIVNSTPAALEYNYAQVAAGCADFSHIKSVQGANRFRLIIVGDNQGWIHGFGEVSATTTVMDKDGKTPLKDANGNPITVATGKVDELWAFMPTDFLGYLDFLQVPKNPHRFMADGSPTIYFLDLPDAANGYPNGNGVFDKGTKERAVAIIGLHKGGRSYYALNIADPFKPTLQWSLVPDEADALASKTLADGSTAIASNLNAKNVTSIVKNMGFSTCVPALGRVVFNDKLRDAVFFGGGYSVTQVDKNFPAYPPPNGQLTPLGRSVLALDAWTGQILAAADLTQVKSDVGPVGTGLIPFEFYQNTGLVQRAYFTDLTGGLWSWDQNTLSSTAPFAGFRMDTSDLSKWASDGVTSSSASSKIRQVFQDTNGSNNAVYSTLPAPFLLSYFPGVPHDSSSATPATVGVVMISGDRNNPLDEAVGYPEGSPSNFRLTTIFDRQDSHLWSSNLTTMGNSNVITSTSNLADFSDSPASALPKYTNDPDPNVTTNDAIIPGRHAYYLAPTDNSGAPLTSQTKFGYQIKLPNGSPNAAPPPTTFFPKGITDPYVVSNVAFFSFFVPTEVNPCSGGSGNTYSYKICDVVNPGRSMDKAACITGNALPFSYWVNVPSNFTLFGTQGVFQAGTIPTIIGGKTVNQVKFATLQTSSADAFPKVRVWRVVK